MHRLFSEIDKFDKWSQSFSDIPHDLRSGEWECDYDNWNEIYIEFEDFINSSLND
jgi:hypothetical protein